MTTSQPTVEDQARAAGLAACTSQPPSRDRAAVLAAARVLWDADNASRTAGWRDMAWADMGGSEPAQERVEAELAAVDLLRTA